jgi:hypothetical protein
MARTRRLQPTCYPVGTGGSLPTAKWQQPEADRPLTSSGHRGYDNMTRSSVQGHSYLSNIAHNNGAGFVNSMKTWTQSANKSGEAE